MKPLRISMPMRVLEVGRQGVRLDEDGQINEERCWFLRLDLGEGISHKIYFRKDLLEHLQPALVPGDDVELAVILPVQPEQTDANSESGTTG